MIFLPCVDVLDVLDVVRQKGELELEAFRQQWQAAGKQAGRRRLTQSGLMAAKRHVSYLDAMTPVAMYVEVHEPTWTISCTHGALVVALAVNMFQLSPAVASSSWRPSAHLSRMMMHPRLVCQTRSYHLRYAMHGPRLWCGSTAGRTSEVTTSVPKSARACRQALSATPDLESLRCTHLYLHLHPLLTPPPGSF